MLNLIGCGDDIPPNVEGLNLLDLEDSTRRTLQSSCLSRGGVCLSIIEDCYKLIINRDVGLARRYPYEILLFDLQNDPQENKDLTGIETALRDDL